MERKMRQALVRLEGTPNGLRYLVKKKQKLVKTLFPIKVI